MVKNPPSNAADTDLIPPGAGSRPPAAEPARCNQRETLEPQLARGSPAAARSPRATRLEVAKQINVKSKHKIKQKPMRLEL